MESTTITGAKMMSRYSLVKLALVSVQAIALCTFVSSSVHSQDLGFDIDYDRSRQFFEVGNEKMAEEIDEIEASNDGDLLKIEHSENHADSEEIEDSGFMDKDRDVEHDDDGLQVD